jgi:uncharacterized membrane protein YjjP (DUF1212 family)
MNDAKDTPGHKGRLEDIDAAMDTAALVFQSGGTTNLADTTFRNVLLRHNVESVSTVYRIDYIAARVVVDDNPRTILRPLEPLSLHLVRASEAALLAERIGRGEIDSTDLAVETERIRQLPSPYSRWITLLAAACAAAAFSKTIGGDWGAMLIVVVAAGAGQYLRLTLPAWNLSPYAVAFLCALTSGFVAVAGLRLGLSSVLGATLLSAVIYMVPGVPLINGFIDLVSGRHFVVGVQRLFDATILCFIIAVAVAIVDSAL